MDEGADGGGAHVEGECNVLIAEVAEVAKGQGGTTAIRQLGECVVKLAMQLRSVNGG